MALLYEGPSLLDGSPIVVILTGYARKSKNSKTGDMLQTWILRADEHPASAISSGSDAAICGGCKHRKSKKTGKRSCYVGIYSLLGIYKAYRDGKYTPVSDEGLQHHVQGRFVRLGSYGDPAAVPLPVWQRLLRYAAGHTGYTHQWRMKHALAYRSILMASVDDAREEVAAKKRGFGTFRVLGPWEAPAEDHVLCPASAEAGYVATCATCRQCDGSPTNSIAIYVHGTGKRNFTGGRALPVLVTA